MVDRIEPPTEKNKPNFGNWLLPFENEVWWLTVGTIFFSCFVYQFLELLAGERDGRSFRKWFMDNFYLSIINFTQNYSYEPTSLAGRIFGVSFAFWTMLMGATYTANLASLLVERERSPYKISSITEAIDRQMLMCSHDKSFSDLFIDAEFGQQAKRFPRPNPIDMYQSLNNGECDILIGTLDLRTLRNSIQTVTWSG